MAPCIVQLIITVKFYWHWVLCLKYDHVNGLCLKYYRDLSERIHRFVAVSMSCFLHTHFLPSIVFISLDFVCFEFVWLLLLSTELFSKRSNWLARKLCNSSKRWDHLIDNMVTFNHEMSLCFFVEMGSSIICPSEPSYLGR